MESGFNYRGFVFVFRMLANSIFFFFFFYSDGVFSLLLSQTGEKNDHQWPMAAASSSTKRQLHTQEKTLRLFFVVSGALHDQRNFSSNKL